MKKVLLFVVVVILSSLSANSQINMSINPGPTLNGFYFGYKIDNFVPFIGFQYVSASLSAEIENEEYDDNGNKYLRREKNNANASVFMPYIGAKYFVYQENTVKAYLTACFYKPIVSAKLTEDGQDNGEIKETVDNLSLWGGEFGCGAEYFFSKQFSIGGEFGFRMLLANSEFTDETYIVNPQTQFGEYVEQRTTGDLNLSMTYSKLSLNFYFGD